MSYRQIPLARERSDWLKQRTLGIGGSDVAAIVGCSPWRTAFQVWEDKMGLSEPQKETGAMHWGTALEAPIRQVYADATGLTVTKPETMFQSVEHPFMIANLDGIASDGRLVEIKTASRAAEWGQAGTDEIPDHYLTQVQHYMAVMGATRTDVAVLIAGNDFRIYTVESDPELQAQLIDMEKDFWSLVQTGTPPDPTRSEEAARKYREATAKKIAEASGPAVSAWQMLCAIRRKISDLKEEEDRMKLFLMDEMKDSVSLKFQGQTIASWSLPSTRKTVDSSRLKKERPDIYAAYLRESAPARTFRIYEPKE